MSITIAEQFVNELGNMITMSVTSRPGGITVIAQGPTSLVEHTWTPKEAAFMSMTIATLMRETDSDYETYTQVQEKY